MESQNRKQQLLRQYAARDLQGEDLAEFRELAQIDIEFRREAELERRISEAIKKGQREKIRQTINQGRINLKAEEQPEPGRVVSIFGQSVPMNWAAAASVVAILTLSLLVWKLTKSDDSFTAQTDVGRRVIIEQQEIAPAFGLAGADSVKTSTVPVVLYVGEADQPQYSFAADTLRLYGNFQPDALTLIIRRPANDSATYQLRANGLVHTLDRRAVEPTPLRP